MPTFWGRPNLRTFMAETINLKVVASSAKYVLVMAG